MDLNSMVLGACSQYSSNTIKINSPFQLSCTAVRWFKPSTSHLHSHLYTHFPQPHEQSSTPTRSCLGHGRSHCLTQCACAHSLTGVQSNP